MAIFTPGSGYTRPIVQDKIRFNIGGQGQPVMGPATNNRTPTAAGRQNGGVIPTPAFSQLDSQILALDAQFDQLPNQAAWNTWAAAIIGSWQLCANCQPDSTGKKLFRQVNFSRSQQGQALITIPPSLTNFAPTPDITAFLFYNHGTGWTGVGGVSIETGGTWLTAQMGLVGANPIYHVDASDFIGGFITGGYLNWLLAILTALGMNPPPMTTSPFDASVCISADDGTPGLKGAISGQVQY